MIDRIYDGSAPVQYANLAKSVNPGVCVDSDDVIDPAALVADWEIRNFRYLQGFTRSGTAATDFMAPSVGLVPVVSDPGVHDEIHRKVRGRRHAFGHAPDNRFDIVFGHFQHEFVVHTA